MLIDELLSSWSSIFTSQGTCELRGQILSLLEYELLMFGTQIFVRSNTSSSLLLNPMKKAIDIRFLVMASALAIGLTSAKANLIQNPGFESGSSDWTFVGSSGLNGGLNHTGSG